MSRQEPNYFRASLGMKEAIAPAVAEDYQSDIVDWMRNHGHRLDLPGLSFRLAKEFGFCYGVDKAVDMAYEARAKFPDKRIFLTYEIIHNPRVNRRLQEMGILFLSGGLAAGHTFDDIQADDVVLMPAFGVPVDYLERLKSKGSILVDTTCGSVVHVWKRVEKYAKDGFTSLVHGKALHAETRATVSQAHKFGGATLVVRDREEAELVCAIIRDERPSSDLAKLGIQAPSHGFDPEKHLQKIGVANQTTMLASESLEIARMVGESMKARYGEAHMAEHFRSFDTICSATQERQDAIVEMAQSGEVNLMLIIGGYNSSNTGHLLEIVGEGQRAFHISDSSEILSATEIRHKPAGAKETKIAQDWIPEGTPCIGITAGASTPNRAIGETIERMAELLGKSAELRALLTV